MQHLFLLTLAASTAHALLPKRQYQAQGSIFDYLGSVDDQNTLYLDNICIPHDPNTGLPDANAPCMASSAIFYQCVYGVDVFNMTDGSSERRRQVSDPPSDGPSDDDDGDDDDLLEQTSSAQRTCICESQFFDQTAGCMDCYKAHGGVENVDYIPLASFTALSSSYCAAGTTPTANFEHYYNAVMTEPSTSTSASATPIADPVGNKTAVSLYFTPSVSYPAAYSIAQPTVSTTGGKSTIVSYTSSNIVSGQIVPTAAVQSSGSSPGTSPSGSASGSGRSASGTTASASASSSASTSSAGAMETAAVKAGAVGVLGIAAVAAML